MAYRTDDAARDPEVYVRDCQAANPDWVPVNCRLDAFLSAAAVIEIVLGAPIARAAEGPTRYADLILGLDRVQLPHLGWPRGVATSYYKGRDLLAFAHDQEGYDFAFVGARHPDALHELASTRARIGGSTNQDPGGRTRRSLALSPARSTRATRRRSSALRDEQHAARFELECSMCLKAIAAARRPRCQIHRAYRGFLDIDLGWAAVAVFGCLRYSVTAIPECCYARQGALC